MDLSPSAEPVGWAGALTALAVATIPLLRAFGINVTEDQSTAILAFLAPLIAVGALLVRSKVTPVANADAKITVAYHATPGVDAKPTV